MLFANLDITTHVLTWIITLLADNESIQDELRAEVGANADQTQNYINRKDSLMHYCFLESIRVRPVSGELLLPILFQGPVNEEKTSILNRRKLTVNQSSWRVQNT